MNTQKKTNPKFGKGLSSWNKGIPRSQATKDKISNSMGGKRSPNYGKREEEASGWKGDNAKSKSAMHKWVERCKGLAKNHLCQHCGKVRAKDWSNKDHKYRRKLDDYAALCRGCHLKYDNARREKKSTNNTLTRTFGNPIKVKYSEPKDLVGIDVLVFKVKQ